MFKQKNVSPGPPAGVDPTDPVQQARRRARHRLIGAIVLLGIGIIGFPLVFETQPRPVPVDIPIEIPRKDNAPALTMPAARSADDAGGPVAASSPKPRPPSAAASRGFAAGDDIVTESRQDAGRELAPASGKAVEKGADRGADASVDQAAAARAAEKAAAEKSAEKAATRTTEKAAEKTVEKSAVEKATAEKAGVKTAEKSGATASAGPDDDGARARALLEGRADVPPRRFVVQVGAFADAASAREARQRVEKAGLKTYTQVAQTPSGDRVRVRVGPFATREEAEAALAKAKAAGLTAVVLTL